MPKLTLPRWQSVDISPGSNTSSFWIQILFCARQISPGAIEPTKRTRGLPFLREVHRNETRKYTSSAKCRKAFEPIDIPGSPRRNDRSRRPLAAHPVSFIRRVRPSSAATVSAAIEEGGKAARPKVANGALPRSLTARFRAERSTGRAKARERDFETARKYSRSSVLLISRSRYQ